MGLYDSIDDKWSRNAKRQFSKADLLNVVESAADSDVYKCPRCNGKGEVMSGGSKHRCNDCTGLGICSDTLDYDDLVGMIPIDNDMSHHAELQDPVDARSARRRDAHMSKFDNRAPVSRDTGDYVFESGDLVRYRDVDATVEIPNGPNNTIGIMIEGKMRMVNAGDITKIEEGVMGMMTNLSPINRVMQLAGISAPFNIEAQEPLTEDSSSTMFDQLIQQNQSQFGEDADSARIYAIGAVLAMIAEQLDPAKAVFKSQAAQDFIKAQTNLFQTVKAEAANFISNSKIVHGKTQQAAGDAATSGTGAPIG